MKVFIISSNFVLLIFSRLLSEYKEKCDDILYKAMWMITLYMFFVILSVDLLIDFIVVYMISL